MSAAGTGSDHPSAGEAPRLLWPVAWWPAPDRETWLAARQGKGPEGLDNPAVYWGERTLKKNTDGYGRYVSWLARNGVLSDAEPLAARITPQRVADYVAALKATLAPVSVAMTIGALSSSAKALAPTRDWSWLSLRYSRLKMKAKPSREKRHAVQHSFDLYRFGKQLMDTADAAPGERIMPALRYQAGLIIALLAARPLRIRNFQALTVGKSLRWDGRRYWLTFSGEETKTGGPIDEPLPDDLVPYLEAFLKVRRPVLLRQASKFGNDPTHCRLWVDRAGKAMREGGLRDFIERYTGKEFGTALWPHLFRDCLLTSVAIDQPDLMTVSATLLGHSSPATGEKHYNQSRMIDAGRRYAATVSELREGFLDTPQTRRRPA